MLGGIIMIDPKNIFNSKKLIVDFNKGYFILNHFSLNWFYFFYKTSQHDFPYRLCLVKENSD